MFILLFMMVACANSIKFENIADTSSGLKYSRTYGAKWDDIIEPFLNGGPKPDSIPILRQHPGVAVFDYDSDGDLDIFITNGPEEPHSLFENQLIETGSLSFIDVAINAGFGDSASIKHDGSGVCYGDIDNDNDHDLLILGNGEYNFLYENNGDGTFTLLQNSGINLQTKQFHSTSCSFGDIDNDGFIDVVIANSADTKDISAISGISVANKINNVEHDPFQYNEYNELYRNNGDHTFDDISDRIHMTVFDDNTHNYDAAYNGKATITWAIEMVDINNDGFIDIVHADDTLGLLPPFGVPKGIMHIFFNQGNSHFVDVPNTVFGFFMGNSAADINCDNHIDLFMSDFGGVMSSRWYFGNGEGRFTPTDRHIFDRENTDRIISPFGWGNAIFDYDNDGDLDIAYHGGMEDKHKIIANNPGVIFENVDGCFAEYTVPSPEQLFDVDTTCLGCTIHTRRNVKGLAIGDLNNDGFYDIVTSSNIYYGTDFPSPYIPENSVFKENPFFENHNFYFNHYINPITGEPESWKPQRGDLAVEICNKGNNINNFFHVTVKGAKGILDGGSVNRDAIGAVLTVHVENKENKPVTIPIEGGSSHLSQHSLQKIFGMGSEQNADLTIKYPYKNGGYIVNKLNNIRPSENLILYEIPCNYESKNEDFNKYSQCVQQALCILQAGGFMDEQLVNRLYNSAFDSIEQTIIECNENIDNEMTDAFTIPQFSPAVIAEIELAPLPLAHEIEIPANQDCHTVSVEILTDNFGGETSWEIIEHNEEGGPIIMQPSGTLASATLVQFDYELSGGHCYEFIVFDSFGDGICCGFGVGYLQLEIDGVQVWDSMFEGASDSYEFCLDICCSTFLGDECESINDCCDIDFESTGSTCGWNAEQTGHVCCLSNLIEGCSDNVECCGDLFCDGSICRDCQSTPGVPCSDDCDCCGELQCNVNEICAYPTTDPTNDPTTDPTDSFESLDDFNDDSKSSSDETNVLFGGHQEDDKYLKEHNEGFIHQFIIRVDDLSIYHFYGMALIVMVVSVIVFCLRTKRKVESVQSLPNVDNMTRIEMQ